jgi:hypothetical protein
MGSARGSITCEPLAALNGLRLGSIPGDLAVAVLYLGMPMKQSWNSSPAIAIESRRRMIYIQLPQERGHRCLWRFVTLPSESTPPCLTTD